MLTRALRAGWRAARRLPGLGAVIRTGDRLWWWRAIRRSGLVDPEFYAVQRGWRSAGVGRAALDYVGRGHRDGLSLNPLVDELVLGRGLPEADRVPALYAYLVSDREGVRTHPWWDGAGGLEATWAARASASVRLRFGDAQHEVPVRALRDWALGAAAAWRRGSVDGMSTRVDGDIAVIRLLQSGDRRYDEKLLQTAMLPSRVVPVVVGVGVDPAQWIAVDALRRFVPEVGACLVGAGTSFADAVARGRDSVSASTLVVVDPRSTLAADDMLELASAAVAGPVGPVQLAADGTIESVGAARVVGRRPYRILNGHPLEDLHGFGADEIEVPLLSGRTFAVEATDFDTYGGLETRDGDLALEQWCLRRRAAEPSVRFRVLGAITSPQFAPLTAFAGDRGRGQISASEADRAEVEEILAVAGFVVTGWGPTGSEPIVRLARPRGSGERWAIRTSSPAGPAGDVWGDTHFARGLANALRRLGREVVVDAYEARDRSSAYLDDVTIVVRGPHRVVPPSTGVRIAWIISHPDEITRRELDDFDMVFAASERWSRTASRELGVPIAPLLECTDTDQFAPRGLERGDEIVFVGTSRGIARPSVVAPLAAGVPVRVYGPDWRGFIPSSAIAASSIPNDALSERYETAAVVLNDHWPAMRREGFMAMRPFDVVAAGGRVISEDVDDIESLFDGAVVVYRSEEQLVELLRGDLDELFPDDTRLAVVRERVRREHSFDARAAELVAAVGAAHVNIGQSRSKHQIQ